METITILWNNGLEGMKFQPPKDWSEAERVANEVDWTMLVPYSEVSEDLPFDEIPSGSMSRLVREKSNGGDVRNESTLLNSARGGIWQINLQALWRLYYEHRRYTFAQGFSDTEMDVLRAVEFADSQRVSFKEIKDSEWIQGSPSDSTLYNAIDGLIEKGLIERIVQNNYKYTGPPQGR